jgi:hypothetical protein
MHNGCSLQAVGRLMRGSGMKRFPGFEASRRLPSQSVWVFVLTCVLFAGLQGLQVARAGSINTVALCGNASYCVYTSEASFLAAVGTNPLGQQNFAGYPASGSTDYQLVAGVIGSSNELNVIDSSVETLPSNMSGNVIASNGEIDGSMPAGTYYLGFDYSGWFFNNPVDNGNSTTAVQVYDGPSAGTDLLANVQGLAYTGFFGIVSSQPIDSFELAASDEYLGDLLYAGGPLIGPGNPLPADSQIAGNNSCSGASCMSSGTSGCNGFFCDFWDDVEGVGAAVAGESGVYTYGGYLDPAGTNAYTYQTLNGALFTSLGGFPTGFSSEFDVSSGGINYGLFGPGQTLTFPGAGVTSFTITGINPAVDGSSPVAFPIEVALNEADAQVEAIAFNQTTTSTPEPSSIVLCIAGLALIGLRIRPRPGRRMDKGSTGPNSSRLLENFEPKRQATR